MERLRRYGQAAVVIKPLVDSNGELVSGISFASGDVQFSVDGASFTALSSLPAELAPSSGWYTFSLSAGILTGEYVAVRIVDQTSTASPAKEWADDGVIIITGGDPNALLDGA